MTIISCSTNLQCESTHWAFNHAQCTPPCEFSQHCSMQSDINKCVFGWPDFWIGDEDADQRKHVGQCDARWAGQATIAFASHITWFWGPFQYISDIRILQREFCRFCTRCMSQTWMHSDLHSKLLPFNNLLTATVELCHFFEHREATDCYVGNKMSRIAH